MYLVNGFGGQGTISDEGLLVGGSSLQSPIVALGEDVSERVSALLIKL